MRASRSALLAVQPPAARPNSCVPPTSRVATAFRRLGSNRPCSDRLRTALPAVVVPRCIQTRSDDQATKRLSPRSRHRSLARCGDAGVEQAARAAAPNPIAALLAHLCGASRVRATRDPKRRTNRFQRRASAPLRLCTSEQIASPHKRHPGSRAALYTAIDGSASAETTGALPPTPRASPRAAKPNFMRESGCFTILYSLTASSNSSVTFEAYFRPSGAN